MADEEITIYFNVGKTVSGDRFGERYLWWVSGDGILRV